MKVLQINSVFGIGSTGRIAADLHENLLSLGHESHVAYGRLSPNEHDKSLRIGNNLDNYLHVIKTRLLDKHGFGSYSATKKFIEYIKHHNPNIIHLHNLHGYYINIGLLFDYFKQANKTIVWTLHDCWPFTGHCTHFDSIGCELWKRQCHDCPQTSEYPKSLICDRSYVNYQQKKYYFKGIPNLMIVTPSKWLASIVKESFLRDYPVTVINNGIDLNVFCATPSTFRRRYNLDKKYILLGVSSIWNERKGIGFFIELAKQLRSDEIIVLIGVSPKQIRQLPDGIIGIAKTNNLSELAQIYSTADVFINPTLEDNFPTTNIEALACSTPVITFNSGGSSECLGNICGLVVDRGDFSGLVASIKYMRQEGKLKYTTKCRKRAEEYYDKYDRFSDYISLYKDMLGR